jgi:hypothetical protein
VKPAAPKAERAKQEIDYGRRGVAGYIFGAFQPASGAALTHSYDRRTTANWVDFPALWCCRQKQPKWVTASSWRDRTYQEHSIG